MQQRLPSLLEHPIAFAHRGAKAHARENTIDAFALALRLGATGLESDVWLTADGVPVLDHDGVVRVQRRKRSIADLRRDQLPAHIPTLADLFERCGTDYHLSLDLKDDAVGPAVIDVVRETAPDIAPRLWLCHPRYEELVALRPLDDASSWSTRPGCSASARVPSDARRRSPSVASMASTCTTPTGTVASSRCSTASTALRSAGTCSTSTSCVRRLRMGLDGVYSDHVDGMVDAYRAELEPRG